MAEAVLRSLKDDVVMATNLRGKIGVLGRLLSFVALAFRNGLECRNALRQLRSALCVQIWRGSFSNLEFCLLIFFIVGLCKKCKKWHIRPITSERTETVLTIF